VESQPLNMREKVRIKLQRKMIVAF